MIRIHGNGAVRAILVHGGPGAHGSMAELGDGLARQLCTAEPYQSARSIRGLIAELDFQIACVCGQSKTVLVGHSFGAWLAALYAAAHPERVQKLILVGCGPLEQGYVPEILRRRLARLTPEDAEHFVRLTERLERGESGCGDGDLRELGALASGTDAVDELAEAAQSGNFFNLPDRALYAAVWPEAQALRTGGALTDCFSAIRCPIVAVQGMQDPHPAEGVIGPLHARGIAVKAYLLERCGHCPWRERAAREQFLQILLNEIAACELSEGGN